MKIFVESIEKSTAKTGNEFLKVSCKSEDKKSHLLYLWDGVENFENSYNAGTKIYECQFGGDANFPKITSYEASNGVATQFYDFIYQNDEQAIQIYESLVSNITDPFLRALVDTIMNKSFMDKTVKDYFIIIPAAKHYHHNFRYGLLRHTHEVMSFISRVSDAGLFKDCIDKQVLLTAGFLHDVGKVYEYSFDGINTGDYGETDTINQIYLGSHLYKGAEMVALAYDNLLNKENSFNTKANYLKAEHIKHIIMSHHLQQEWGAIPKQPKTLEAYLVFEGDYFSAAFGKYSTLDWETVSTTDLMRSTSKYDNFFGFTPLIKSMETEET